MLDTYEMRISRELLRRIMGRGMPISRVAKHLVTVPVTVNGSYLSRVILDTGIGVNLILKHHAPRFGLATTGETYTGRRMSGQPVTFELANLPSLQLGEVEQKGIPVAVFDMGNLPPEMDDVVGILSLGFFEKIPFTLDYPKGELRLHDRAPARASRVPLRLSRDGPSVTAYLRMVLPKGRSVEVEMDSGTDCLILHSKFIGELGIDPADPATHKREGKDETGFAYTRYFAPIRGEVCLEGAPEIRQRDPYVMFQDIIYDGLVGDEFLRQFAVTVDLADGSVSFAPPGQQPPPLLLR
jgi:hypothetical protein